MSQKVGGEDSKGVMVLKTANYSQWGEIPNSSKETGVFCKYPVNLVNVDFSPSQFPLHWPVNDQFVPCVVERIITKERTTSKEKNEEYGC
jgi:hypothetical protein